MRRFCLGAPGRLGVGALILLAGLAGCGSEPQYTQPNVLWVVWDSARADRLALYGHDRPTTPWLDEWAGQARLFENCMTVAGTTAPAHVSMFTGLLPREHGVNHANFLLDQEVTTIAEIFKDNGYQTFMYAESPYLDRDLGFGQGFDQVVHPWDPEHRQAVTYILERKIPPRHRNPKLAEHLQSAEASKWTFCSSGELATGVFKDWMEERDRGRPFFAFLNYMEAHHPILAPQQYRLYMLPGQEVELSYRVNTSRAQIWSYTFGLAEYKAGELALIQMIYDAAIAELDQLFHDLLGMLNGVGALDNTIVVLVGDHGEQLGEHHQLDHQYSLYEPVLHVPLLIHFPPRVAPGRDDSPVMNMDIFPTLLDLAGIAVAVDHESFALNLLAPQEDRTRFAEHPAPLMPPINDVNRANPPWNPAPWVRSLEAIRRGDLKLIYGSDGRHELYDLASDPTESRNLLAQQPAMVAELSRLLQELHARYPEPQWPDSLAASPPSE